jgi:phospholipid-binding lipoprotein MlaA
MENSMRLSSWTAVLLAAAVGGCAGPQGGASDGQHAVRPERPASPLAENPGQDADDADFDILEAELDEQMAETADPLEFLNRITYRFNDMLYLGVLEPVAGAYERAVPHKARTGVLNFFNNLLTPARLANCLLQGKGRAARTELDRFLVNTTVGVLGFGDPARKKYGLEPVSEDLGQTLAAAGFGDGFYLVLPVLGPSTLRDTAGFIGDQFLNPIRYVRPWEASLAISAVRFTNEYSFHLGEYEAFKSAAVDPYVAMRQAYIQHRKKQIEQ